MADKDKLKEYKSKRDFKKTSEPSGKKKKSSGKPIFVIQKHDASNLHYDFRIEVDGVLKSWAIPKGPSTDPDEKRLALPTEDHPTDYADFEGVIPEGNYGAGTVLVWDTGEYENKSHDDDEDISVDDAYDNGKIEVFLKGKKLEGSYMLIRTSSGDDEKWMFFKKDDDYADARRNPVSTEPNSVLSGKSLDEIRKAVEDQN